MPDPYLTSVTLATLVTSADWRKLDEQVSGEHSLDHVCTL